MVDAPARVSEAAELLEKWGVVPGDVWSISGRAKHRLACGDSTKGAQVSVLLGSAVPFLMVTDPPYGVQYDPEWRHDAGVNNSAQIGKVNNDDRASWAAAFAHFRGSVAYVWHAGLWASTVERSLLSCGMEIRSQIIWLKTRFAISRGHYHWRHEPAWYAVRTGESAKWNGGRKQDTVWGEIVDQSATEDLFAARVDEETILAFDGRMTTVWEVPADKACGGGHSTQKPVELMRRSIANHGDSSDAVYDPFGGTGSTMVAADGLGRPSFVNELDPKYCAVILQRMADMGCECVRLVRGEG
jgi:DNA modification methylase